MGPMEFSEAFVQLNRQPICFDGRPYLSEVYGATVGNLVLRTGRQVEKSTLLANTILYEAFHNPGSRMLFVCPRAEQARMFMHSRLFPILLESPVIRRALLGSTARKPPVTNVQFRNGSELHVRAAFRTADAARGISADLLLVDEFQDMAPGHLPVLQETLSHARDGRTILTGTPKMIDNHLEGMFALSTANEWTVTCSECAAPFLLDERCLGPRCIVCPHCQTPADPRGGRWIPRNPLATWGHGFCISHLMATWIRYEKILEKQRTYDVAQFKNEVLGLSTSLGDHLVTRAELEACCTDRPMATSYADAVVRGRRNIIAGVDWGGGGTSRTVLVLGFLRSDYAFQIVRFERYTAQEDPVGVVRNITQICEQFRVRWIAADGGGNGHMHNRLLLDQLDRDSGLYAILYSASGQQPSQDGILTRWTVHRSATIGSVFSRIRKKSLLFPRLADCSSFLDEFACEIAVYDNENRTVRYTHPPTQLDDALHATNYALHTAIHLQSQRGGWDDDA